MNTMKIDKSDSADAKRMRWMLAGHGYFMEEEMLCGNPYYCDEQQQDEARARIDAAMADETPDKLPG